MKFIDQIETPINESNNSNDIQNIIKKYLENKSYSPFDKFKNIFTKKISKEIESKLNLFQMFSSNIDNLWLNTSNTKTLSEYTEPKRGPGIPRDAIIVLRGSYTIKGTFNDKTIEFANILWKWVRSNGKSTQTYYKNTGAITLVSSALKEYENIKIKDDSVFSKIFKKYSENKKLQDFSYDLFNKRFDLYGDPIKSRKLFNATEQEKYVKISEITKKNVIEIKNKTINIMFICKETFMLVNYPFYKWKDQKIIDGIILDLHNDYEMFLNYFSFISCLRKISR